MYRNVLVWIMKTVRDISECGPRLKKMMETKAAIRKGRCWRAELLEKQRVLQKRLDLESELHSGYPHRISVIPALPIRYMANAKGLRNLMIAALLLEVLVAMSLAPILFWMIPTPIAIICGVLFAVVVAIGSHGAASMIFCNDSPRRKMRLLRVILNVLAGVTLALLIPVTISRVIIIPVWISNFAIGMSGIVLPLLTGVASALRRAFLDAFPVPMAELSDVHNAIRLIDDQLGQWAKELRLYDDIVTEKEAESGEAAAA